MRTCARSGARIGEALVWYRCLACVFFNWKELQQGTICPHDSSRSMCACGAAVSVGREGGGVEEARRSCFARLRLVALAFACALALAFALAVFVVVVIVVLWVGHHAVVHCLELGNGGEKNGTCDA